MMKLFPLLLLLVSPLFADNALTVIVKQHENRADNFADRPYGQDDLSYGVYLDAFEGIGGWRLGAAYSADLSGPGGVDSVITPEIGLIGAEGVWESGISLLMDYTDVDGETDWGDLYYQIYLGLNLPLGPVEIGAHAYYPFDRFSHFTDIGFNELDYGLQIRIRF